MTKCIIFGVGRWGEEAYKILKDIYESIVFSDNDRTKWDSALFGCPVISPNRIPELNGSDVFIAMKRNRNAIKKQLEAMGCKSIKTIVQYYSFEEKKTRFDIVCCNGIDIIDKNFDSYIVKNSIEMEKDFHEIKPERRVLMIANCFPPAGGGGVQRPLKFAKYLSDYGYKPTVIAQGFSTGDVPIDVSLLDETSNMDVIYMQNRPILIEECNEDQLNMIRSLYYSIVESEEWMDEYTDYYNEFGELIPDDSVTWVASCIDQINNVIDIQDYSIVYTTSSPYSSHMLGYYLKTRYGISWVMDYRDPWCLNEYGMKVFYSNRKGSYELEKSLELSLLKHADYVISVSDVLGDEFRKNIPQIRYKTITNGYDEDDFADISDKHGEYFDIVYNGRDYPYYDFVSLICIVNELIEKSAIDRSDIRIVLNGTIRRTKMEGIERSDKYGIVRYNGYLSHGESLLSSSNASILWLFGSYGKGAYYHYTGKIFEYIRLGIPILSFSSSYGIHYEMIEKHGFGITASSEDKTKISGFIIEEYDIWKKGLIQRRRDDRYVRGFSRKSLTKELADVFDSILLTH